MQTRSEKEDVVRDLAVSFGKAKVAIVAEFNKLDVAAVTELRKRCRAAKVDYKVVKNTLAKRAAKGTSLAVIEDLLAGPTALVMGYDDPIGAAKVLADFMKDKDTKDTIKVRGGMAEGKKIDAKGVEALAKMPGLPQLRATILRMINTPATQLVRIIAAPGTQLARVISAHAEKTETPAA
jgi:large subunit ribosomal protein L10